MARRARSKHVKEAQVIRSLSESQCLDILHNSGVVVRETDKLPYLRMMIEVGFMRGEIEYNLVGRHLHETTEQPPT